MSRIGKQPITVPSGTTIKQTEGFFEVTGPKGVLEVSHMNGVSLQQTEQELQLTFEAAADNAIQGLQRTLLFNAITGVSQGWSKNLELHGVGMRAAISGSDLTLSLGFSHPVTVSAPAGITFSVVKNVITVSGIDKQLVGETSAQIRKLRKPEPYKGKGIRYSTESIRRKAGKTGKAK